LCTTAVSDLLYAANKENTELHAGWKHATELANVAKA
jgi:hypothetical protein